MRVQNVGRRAATFTTTETQGRMQILHIQREERLKFLAIRKNGELKPNEANIREMAQQIELLKFVNSLLLDVALVENEALAMLGDSTVSPEKLQKTTMALAKRKEDTMNCLRGHV